MFQMKSKKHAIKFLEEANFEICIECVSQNKTRITVRKALVDLHFKSIIPPTAILKVAKLAYFRYIIFIV